MNGMIRFNNNYPDFLYAVTTRSARLPPSSPQRAQRRRRDETGDYNDLWGERNYLRTSTR